MFPLLLPKGSFSLAPYDQSNNLGLSSKVFHHLSSHCFLLSLSLLSFCTFQNWEISRVSLHLLKRALQINLGTKTHPFHSSLISSVLSLQNPIKKCAL